MVGSACGGGGGDCDKKRKRKKREREREMAERDFVYFAFDRNDDGSVGILKYLSSEL